MRSTTSPKNYIRRVPESRLQVHGKRVVEPALNMALFQML